VHVPYILQRCRQQLQVASSAAALLVLSKHTTWQQLEAGLACAHVLPRSACSSCVVLLLLLQCQHTTALAITPSQLAGSSRCCCWLGQSGCCRLKALAHCLPVDQLLHKGVHVVRPAAAAAARMT
jgi:hypothetical protein